MNHIDIACLIIETTCYLLIISLVLGFIEITRVQDLNLSCFIEYEIYFEADLTNFLDHKKL